MSWFKHQLAQEKPFRSSRSVIYLESYDRILIAAPQQQIEEGFTNESGAVRYPYDARTVPLLEIRASRDSSLKSRQYLKAFLSGQKMRDSLHASMHRV